MTTNRSLQKARKTYRYLAVKPETCGGEYLTSMMDEMESSNISASIVRLATDWRLFASVSGMWSGWVSSSVRVESSWSRLMLSSSFWPNFGLSKSKIIKALG